MTVPLPGALVSGSWLAQQLAADPRADPAAPGLRVVDVRWYLDGRSGREAWSQGHVPTAVWLDVDTELSEPASAEAGRHPLASPERFAAALGRAGIAAGAPVVAYDDAGGSVAARLWWMLHSLGEPVAVLDGGLAAWPGALSSQTPQVQPVAREPVPWPIASYVDAGQVALAAESVLFDARTAERYTDGGPVDPRPGHIPGAISAPWQGNLGTDGRFLPPQELRDRFAAAADRPAIAYCGSGVTACHDLLAMHLAGIDRTALYPGSWSQWGADPSRPAET